MSAEGRLLVLCARTAVSEFVRVEITDLVCEGINWDLVWRMSKAHGVAPLVYRNLTAICPAAVPLVIHEAYRRQNQSITLMNTVLAKELVALLEALAAKGITAIPFHGSTLAQVAYGDLSMRECEDIELIVEEGAVSQARKVLWSHGYQRAKADAEPYEVNHVFLRRNGMVTVNLQWGLAGYHSRFRLDRSALWGRLKPVGLPTKAVMGLCPEDLLILLCVHGTIHAWTQLKWVCDIAELVRWKPALDWSRVLFQASEWGCRRMVLLGLAMAQNLFDIVLPRTVSHEIDADADLPLLVQRMPQQLLKRPDQGIDEDCADAVSVTIKDSIWERWKLSLILCRADAEVIHRPLPWFRFQRQLRLLSTYMKPLLRGVPKGIVPVRVRHMVVSWLQSS
ncbi:MAG: nucleotidyltransferase family protein [Nitrospira sp.]